jgi:hypothetical protein
MFKIMLLLLREIGLKQYYILRKIFKKHNGIVLASDFKGEPVQWDYLNSLVKYGAIRKIRRGVYQWDEPWESWVRRPRVDYLGENSSIASQVTGLNQDLGIVSRLFPEAIICMESALYFYKYLGLVPRVWDLAFDRDVNKRRLSLTYPSIRPYFMESYLLEIGISDEKFRGYESVGGGAGGSVVLDDARGSRGRSGIDAVAGAVEHGSADYGNCGGGAELRIYDRERLICEVLRRANKIDRETLNAALRAYIGDEKKNIPRLIEYSKELRVYSKVQQWIQIWLN